MCGVFYAGPRGFKAIVPPGGLLRHLFSDADISEGPEEIVVRIPLPGLTKEDFDLMVGPDSLVVTLKQKQESEEKDEDTEFGFGHGPWQLPCGHGSGRTRRVQLPAEVNPETAKAKLDSGVLKVTVGKKSPGRRVSVE